MTIRNLDALLRPHALIWLGHAQTPAHVALLDKLRAGPLRAALDEWSECIPPDAAVRESVLAVIAESRFAQPEIVERLCGLGCRGLLWPLAEPPSRVVLEAARRHTLRILGPRSIGLALGSGLDASTLAQTPLPGSLALIVQSQSVAAAAADWAAGRRIGFSWIAATGGESDVDVADLLDYAALDSHTQAVAVEVGHIRGARKFMSAARACARAKPTVILQTRLADRSAVGADPVRSAAFARAGMVEVPDLPGLFDALASLQRLGPMDQPRVLVFANGASLCALSTDALLRQGLSLAELDEAQRQALLQRMPGARFRPGSVDIGEPTLDETLAGLKLLLESRQIDALLFVRSPVAGHPHMPVATALAAAAPGPRLLSVWLGLESAAPARRISAEAGQSTFTSPEAAARAMRYRWEYTRNRELLTQTPPQTVLPSLVPQRVAAALQEHLGAGTDTTHAAALELLRAYGLDRALRVRTDALVLGLRLERHPELGMHLRLQAPGRGTSAPVAYGFVPLDGLLAQRLLQAAGLSAEQGIDPRDLVAAETALIRLAQIGMDQPAVERLDLNLVVRGGRARVRKDARVSLTTGPAPERERLALAPYPTALVHSAILGDGAAYAVRPVRPEDEPAVIELLQSLDADSIRLRFFASIRYFSHAMAARMTQIDYDRELALVVHDAAGSSPMRAIGTLIADPDGASAEFALLIHQSYARKGLGRHLLSQFIEHARRRRIERVWGVVLADNTGMLGLARSLGFTIRADPEDALCRRVELPVHAG
ncbi:MAG: GNAT family N-acetyltransferase [Panacagrimonas sp.]